MDKYFGEKMDKKKPMPPFHNKNMLSPFFYFVFRPRQGVFFPKKRYLQKYA